MDLECVPPLVILAVDDGLEPESALVSLIPSKLDPSSYMLSSPLDHSSASHLSPSTLEISSSSFPGPSRRKANPLVSTQPDVTPSSASPISSQPAASHNGPMAAVSGNSTARAARIFAGLRSPVDQAAGARAESESGCSFGFALALAPASVTAAVLASILNISPSGRHLQDIQAMQHPDATTFGSDTRLAPRASFSTLEAQFSYQTQYTQTQQPSPSSLQAHPSVIASQLYSHLAISTRA
ncbi:hypothetical protein EDB83DRAFT_2513757 [Lactarius deliciosus]|nr:hypothetical protein EDB83DRAFT_2513757 [Lactarius deliciosus]